VPDTQKILQTRKEIGLLGEKLAADFLRRKGYRILERNVRVGRGEIDLIALDGETLVFVEVKTRKGLGFGHPSEAITHRKRRQLSKLALLYMQRRGMVDLNGRFDVISVLIPPKGKPTVEHIENAFELDSRYVS
jgi:putative endonuclease